MIEDDPLVGIEAGNAGALDDAAADPLTDKPRQRVDLGRVPIGRGEGHVRGPWRSLHATIPHTQAVAAKELMPRTANVVSSAVMRPS